MFLACRSQETSSTQRGSPPIVSETLWRLAHRQSHITLKLNPVSCRTNVENISKSSDVSDVTPCAEYWPQQWTGEILAWGLIPWGGYKLLCFPSDHCSKTRKQQSVCSLTVRLALNKQKHNKIWFNKKKCCDWSINLSCVCCWRKTWFLPTSSWSSLLNVHRKFL